MNINFAEFGTCRGHKYENGGSIPLEQILAAKKDEEARNALFEEHTALSVEIIDALTDEDLRKLQAGQLVVGNTEEGSFAVGPQSQIQLLLAAKVHFAESMGQ